MTDAHPDTHRGTSADYESPPPSESFWPGDQTQLRTLADYAAAEGRFNPHMVRMRTGWASTRINELTNTLESANWLARLRVYGSHDGAVHDVHALYEWNAADVYDPRPVGETLRIEGGWDLSPSEARSAIAAAPDRDRLAVHRDNELARDDRGTQHASRVKVLRALADKAREFGIAPESFLGASAGARIADHLSES